MNAVVQHNTSFPAMLNAYKAEIARALPRHLDGNRMARIALTCFRQNPKLGECYPKSVFASVIMAAQLGLEPGIGGQAYLIPYGQECQFVPGWQGLVDLVSRAGRASVWTGAVFEGDEFDYALGDSPHVTHRPAGDEDESSLTHVYAVGRVEGSQWPVIEVWPKAKVLRHRDRYNKVGKRHYSYAHFEMYARKIALLQVLKYMPKSVELQTAIALEHAAEQGGQHLDVHEAIDGTWTPADTLQEEPTASATTVMPLSKSARHAGAAPSPSGDTAAAAVEPEPAPTEPGIFVSGSLERILLDTAKCAGIPRAALLERYPRIDKTNYNAIRQELKAMADATVAEAAESAR